MGRAGLFLTLLLVIVGLALPAAAQMPIPVDVFVQHDRTLGTATIYFVNPVTGLSTPVSIAGISAEQLVTELFTVLPQGVLYRSPADGRVQLILPDGQVIAHPFIPQQRALPLDAVNWVLSPDGQSIAWAEVISNGAGGWQSALYYAAVDGSAISAVPPPADTSFLQQRVLPLALTNDRQRLFYDAAFPMQSRTLTDYFDRFQDIRVYLAAQQFHQPLTLEAGCPCGFAVSADGQAYVQLRAGSGGFEGFLWRFGQATPGLITPIDVPFAQAGDAFYDAANLALYYTQAQNLEDASTEAQFTLVRVDMVTQQQQRLIGPAAIRLRVQGVQDSGQTLLLADVYNTRTYKFDLPSQTLTPVAEGIWLGQIMVGS